MFAVVWHYWIGVAVMIPALFLTIGIVAQFLRRTQAPKYGRDE